MWWDKQTDFSRRKDSKALISQGKESATENIPPCGMAATPIPQGKGEKVR